MKLPAQTPSRTREFYAFWSMVALLILWVVGAPIWAGVLLTGFEGLLLALAWFCDLLAQDYYALHQQWPPGYRQGGSDAIVDLDASPDGDTGAHAPN